MHFTGFQLVYHNLKYRHQLYKKNHALQLVAHNDDKCFIELYVQAQNKSELSFYSGWQSLTDLHRDVTTSCYIPYRRTLYKLYVQRCSNGVRQVILVG